MADENLTEYSSVQKMITVSHKLHQILSRVDASCSIKSFLCKEEGNFAPLLMDDMCLEERS